MSKDSTKIVKVAGKKKLNRYTKEEAQRELDRLQREGAGDSQYYRDVQDHLKVLNIRLLNKQE